jgi:hypothetical protein
MFGNHTVRLSGIIITNTISTDRPRRSRQLITDDVSTGGSKEAIFFLLNYKPLPLSLRSALIYVCFRQFTGQESKADVKTIKITTDN